MIEDVLNRTWDVIVIGTGIGGGTIGRQLAESGASVLFLEKGPTGVRAEQQKLDDEVYDPTARTIRGFWPKPMKAKVNGRLMDFFGPIGAGVGGSSVFYAASLERPERHDLDSKSNPWPVNYDSFRPFFDTAEQMYQVAGHPDPLSDEPTAPLIDPPDQIKGDHQLAQAFRAKGLHPYYGHLGVRFLPGCKNCLGFKCPRACKMDGRSAGVEPALATGNAALLDLCDVRALKGAGDQISHVEAVRNGVTLKLTAKTYILAAGALSSPRLLLASASAEWPAGCANSSGLVGRNLMFHLTEMFALWPGKAFAPSGASKSIALRDLYRVKEQRFGLIQAMGIEASYGEIVHYLNTMFDRSILRKLKPLRQFTRIPALIATRLFGKAKVFAGILEDLPYADNRVLLDADDLDVLRFEYEMAPELIARHQAFRRAIKVAFRGHRMAFLNKQPELNFGHPCGTLKFGDDAKTSVLNRDCRAHEVRNLYVVDASFMPSSTGVNPSLTIAANAVRVAQSVLVDLKTGVNHE